MLKHKVSLLILVSALTVTAAMPAFAANWHDNDHHHDDYEYYNEDDDDWDDDDWDDDDDWSYNFNGAADKLASVARDEAETEKIVSNKTGSEGQSAGKYDELVEYAIQTGLLQSYEDFYGYSSDSRYDSDDYFFFDGGPGYNAKDPVEGSYAQLSNPSSSKTGWNQDNTGWYYVKSDSTYPKDQWERIDGEWYYFNDEGYMQTGWIQYKGSLYYCDATGAMLSDTVTPDGYRFDDTGRLIGLPN